MAKDYLIAVGDVVDERAVEFIVEPVFAKVAAVYLEFIRNIFYFISIEGVVEEIWVVFLECGDQLLKRKEVEGRVL